MHVVAVDRRNAIVSMRLWGFFSLEDAEKAAADLHDAIRSLGPRAGKHVTLYDLTETQVASTELVEHFGRYFTDPAFASIWARKVAFVTESALATLQLRRVQNDRTDIRIFAERQAAMSWLLDEEE